MMSKLEIFFIGLLLVVVYVKAEKKVAIFVFGDSIYDPGNNNYLNLSISDKANHWPYGETFFNFSTGRYCDGRIIPDFIAMNASLPPWRPYLQQNGTQKSFRHGANFAGGGAHAISQNDGWINLKEQLSFFKNATNVLRKEVGEEEAKKILTEAVYMTSIGGDDYATFLGDYPNPTESQLQEYIKLVIGNITEVIKEIYEIGGRKFAFQNAGPMGCTPRALASYDVGPNECYEFFNGIIQKHNNAFLKTAQVLENQLQDFKYLIFDYYTSVYNIVKNPSKYGFKVANSACCGSGSNDASGCGIVPFDLCSNPNEYVFFDGDHPGDHANTLISKHLWNGDSTFTAPFNFEQLLLLQIDQGINFIAKIKGDDIIGDTGNLRL